MTAPDRAQDRMAIAKITGVVGRHRGGGVTRDGALVEIGRVLGEERIFDGRHVLSAVLRRWLDDSEHQAGPTRELLTAAGADPELAARMGPESRGGLQVDGGTLRVGTDPS